MLTVSHAPDIIYRDATGRSLSTYKNAIRGGTSFEFPLSPFDRLGLPLWTVALIGDDGVLSDGFGYGASLEAAQTSAWGECVEWFYARQALAQMPRRHASFATLQGEGENAVDPFTLCLHAGSTYTPQTELEWVQTTRYPDGARFWMPIEFVAPRYADIGPQVDKSRYLVVPITNGSGAGATLEHAVAHGILELLQRDGNSVNYRAMDRGVRIELDSVADPDTKELLAYLERCGIEVVAKLATTDFGMTNLYVVGYDRNVDDSLVPISLSACGESVHPDREFALAKALREFVMARARKAFNHGPLQPVRHVAPIEYLAAFGAAAMRSEDDRALREMRSWMSLSQRQFFNLLRDPIFATRETVRFSELPTTSAPGSAELLDVLSSRLAAEGLEVFYADFSPPDASVRVVKVVVPGLEVETMTYERIGGRNLQRLLERNSDLVGTGQGPATAKPIRLAEGDGEFWFDSAAKERIVGQLYPLYREPGRHVIGFMEESENNLQSAAPELLSYACSSCAPDPCTCQTNPNP